MVGELLVTTLLIHHRGPMPLHAAYMRLMAAVAADLLDLLANSRKEGLVP